MANSSSSTELAARLWAARSMQDVTEIMTMAEQLYGPVERRAVGGRENNIGIIRLASDPGLASVERITNGMDAVLELEALIHTQTASSPRAGALTWLGLGRTGDPEADRNNVRRVAARLQVILDDSGETRRPTMIVEDRGIGQHPDDFACTLLSLNESNKVEKPYTMGTYGQGGSSTLGFSRAAVIISRRHSAGLNGKADTTGWSIVQERDDPARMKLPTYSYMAPEGASGVFELDPACCQTSSTVPGSSTSPMTSRPGPRPTRRGSGSSTTPHCSTRSCRSSSADWAPTPRKRKRTDSRQRA